MPIDINRPIITMSHFNNGPYWNHTNEIKTVDVGVEGDEVESIEARTMHFCTYSSLQYRKLWYWFPGEICNP